MQASADKLTEGGSGITLSKRVVHESYAKNKMAAASEFAGIANDALADGLAGGG